MKYHRHDEYRRRAYWNEQMQEAHKFMADVATCPVADCSEKMISLRDVVDDAGIDVAFTETKLELINLYTGRLI